MVNNKQEILRIYQEFASITSHVLIHLMHEGEEEAEAPMCNHEYPKDICPYCRDEAMNPFSNTAPSNEEEDNPFSNTAPSNEEEDNPFSNTAPSNEEEDNLLPICKHAFLKEVCPYCSGQFDVPTSDTAPPPEKQYRDLEPGEMIQDGDEYSFSGNDWITTELPEGIVNEHGNRYRRPE